MKVQNSKITRIAINVSPLYDGNSVRGVGYYTKNLVEALQLEIKNNPDYKNYQIDLITNIHDLQSTIYDLIHYPFFDPFKLTLPKKTKTPTIITVHDLIPLQFKSLYPAGIKGKIKWFIQKNRLKKVDYIITVSNYSKHIIKNIIGYPENKIFVTYLAANKDFKPSNDLEKLESIRKKYKLPKKFILYVGDLNRNKNIPLLANTCINLNYPLVIVGSSATKKVECHPETKDILYIQSLSSKLILPGFVPDKDLPYLYNLATIYCQPSFAEGFGLPVIEAMQSGCPVVYSNSKGTSLSEIVDLNGESFNPYSSAEIGKALKKIWENPNLQKKYRKLGLKRAKNFDWKYTALQTLAVYNLALIK